MPNPLRVCDCGKVALTEQDLELFKKNHTCRFGRENICIECHNLKTNTLYNPKINARKKKQSVVVSGVDGICRLCHKPSEVFDFYPYGITSAISLCGVCKSDLESRKVKDADYIQSLEVKIKSSDGDVKDRLIKSLNLKKESQKYYFDNLK